MQKSSLQSTNFVYRAGIGNRADRRNEGVGGGDDLVAWSDAESLQRQAEALGPRTTPNANRAPTTFAKSRFRTRRPPCLA